MSTQTQTIVELLIWSFRETLCVLMKLVHVHEAVPTVITYKIIEHVNDILVKRKPINAFKYSRDRNSFYSYHFKYRAAYLLVLVTATL